MQVHKVPSWKERIKSRARETRSGGFDPERLVRLQNVMKKFVDEKYTPGITILVNHRGHEFVHAVGTMAFDSVKPIKRDTIFRLASMTKPVTAVATMILLEESRLRLSDEVQQWLPELTDRKVLRMIDSQLDDVVPAVRPITVRDLLTYRCGYGEISLFAPGTPIHQAMIKNELPLSQWIFPGTPDEFMKRLGTLPLAAQPGERWLYHMGSEILGVLISRVTGQTLGDFMRDRIFEPLGMEDTAFYVPQEKMHRLPVCYGSDMQTGELQVLDVCEGGQMSKQPLFESGAGGLVSTVDDMAAFGMMMLHHGSWRGARILSRPAVELMTMDHLTPVQKTTAPFFENFWNTRGWGLGLGVVTGYDDLGEVPGKFGWDGAFGTSWYVDPKEEIVGVLMTQRRPDVWNLPKLTRDFWAGVYQLVV